MKKLWSLFLCLALLLTAAAPAYAVGAIAPLRCDWSFLAPTGLLLQEDGALLVADGGLNNLVALREGVSSLAAGRTLPYDPSGAPRGGHLDGAAALAVFNTPWSLAQWGGGVAVSDRDNHCLRLLSGGTVKTLAGDGQDGYRDGPAAEAKFSMPLGLATGDDGTLYIADSGNGCIRALNTAGTVSTYVEGLSEPAGLCWYGGALYGTDVGSQQVFRVEDGEIVVLAGATATDSGVSLGGFLDGRAADAEFSTPFGITVTDGVIYVADTGNSAIRQLRDGWVSTLACYRGSAGDLWPGRPTDLTLSGDTLYVADSFAGAVLRLDAGKQLFQDVSVDAWYAQGVSYAYTQGLMQGSSKTLFTPDGALTRGQAVTILYRMEGQPEAEASRFSDVPEELYCAKAASWAVSAGLTEGTGEDAFSPNAPMSREQMVTLLYRYAALKGEGTAERADLSDYLDVDNISAYALESMAWACAGGILQGVGGNRLAPGESVSRGQAAVLLTRMLSIEHA